MSELGQIEKSGQATGKSGFALNSGLRESISMSRECHDQTCVYSQSISDRIASCFEKRSWIYVDILSSDAHSAFPTRPRKAAALQKTR
jgi:hypothetical protein